MGKTRGTVLLIAAFANLPLSAPAGAQSYPNRPIRVIVPNPPGGTLDIVGRLLSPKMTETLGQSVIIDNRPGADTNIGTEFVARAAGDGYTVLLNTVPLVVNPSLSSKLPFNVTNDFAPVSLIVSVPFVLVVHPSVPARSVKEFIALAKSHPGKLNYGSAGNGSNLHVAAELFKNLTATNLVHIQYKGGGPALLAVLSGEVDLSFLSVSAVVPHAKAGKIRALGMTGTRRSPVLPELLTIAESGVPGYEFTSWVGALVPAKTPANIVTVLNDSITKSVRSPDLAKRFTDEGVDIIASTPAQFAAYLKGELVRWAKVVKESGMKAD